MTTAKTPIPQGFHSVTPSLVVRNAAQAIDFYKKALGAKELMRMPAPDGRRLRPPESRPFARLTDSGYTAFLLPGPDSGGHAPRPAGRRVRPGFYTSSSCQASTSR